MMTFGSLFAGIGGFDKGFHDAGMRCAWQVEIDAAARSVLARHWPDVARHADVRDCGAHNLAPVDVICGGFPCQDLSVAGRRTGLAGARSGLFYEMTRIVDELRPMLLVWENVPGLLSSDSGRDFGRVLVELDRIGYSGCWTTLDAQFFGVAQRRQRVFGVFARRSLGAAVCAEILSLTARLPWNTETGRATRAGVAAAVAASAGHHGRSSPRGDGSDNLIAFGQGVKTTDHQGDRVVGEGDVWPTLPAESANNGGGAGALLRSSAPAIALSNRGRDGDVFETVRAGSHGALPMVAAPREARQGKGAFTDPVNDNVFAVAGFGDYRAARPTLAASGGDNGMGSEALVAATLNSGGNNGGFRTEPGEHLVSVFQEAQYGVAEYDSAGSLRAGRIPEHQMVLAFTERTRLEGPPFEAQEDLAYALTNPGSGGRTHSRQIAGGFGVRRLTPLECERLQGFPDGWAAGQADSTRYRQLGNAVAVPVARWIGRRIVEVVGC